MEGMKSWLVERRPAARWERVVVRLLLAALVGLQLVGVSPECVGELRALVVPVPVPVVAVPSGS